MEPRESAENRVRSRYNTYPKAGCMGGGVFDFINQLAVGTIVQWYWRVTNTSPLVQVMAWRLFGAKQLLELIPTYFQLNHQEKNSIEIWNRIPSHYLNQYRHVIHWILRTNFSEISIRIQQFSYKQINSQISSAKWQSFGLGLNVLKLRFTDLLVWYY